MEKNKKYLELALLFLIDLLSIVLTVGIGLLIRGILFPTMFPTPLTSESIFFSLTILLVWLFFFYREGLYTKRFSFWDELKALWRVSFFSTVAALVIVSVGKLSHVASRSLIILSGASSLLILPFLRINAQKMLRGVGLFKRRVIIIGAGDLGRLCLSALRRESNYGYEVIGFIDDDPGAGRTVEGVKVHRGIDKVERYIASTRISDIFIALPEIEKVRILDLISRIQPKVERILYVPDLQSMPMLGTEIHHFFHDQIFSLEIKNNLEKAHNVFMKRVFDGVSSLALLSVLFIPMLLISFAIAVESPGFPLYLQTRIGRDGRPFRVFKFRTMFSDSEERLNDLLQKDEGARRDWEQYWKLRNDPRVTRIGTLLRKTSLDELPQLLNVLRGEMSLVGPRPYLPEELRQFTTEKLLFLRVLPGITGLWQVNGRSNTNHRYRLAIDGWYVQNWSLWLDIVILLKTLKVVTMREGAY